MTTSQIFTVKIILHFLNCCLISCCCLLGVRMFLCVPTGCQSSFRADCWAKPGQWKEIRTFKESQEHTCCFIPFKHQHHRHQHATPTPTPPHTQHHECLWSWNIAVSAPEKGYDTGRRTKWKAGFYYAWNSLEVKDKTQFPCSPGSNNVFCSCPM